MPLWGVECWYQMMIEQQPKDLFVVGGAGMRVGTSELTRSSYEKSCCRGIIIRNFGNWNCWCCRSGNDGCYIGYRLSVEIVAVVAVGIIAEVAVELVVAVAVASNQRKEMA